MDKHITDDEFIINGISSHIKNDTNVKEKLVISEEKPEDSIQASLKKMDTWGFLMDIQFAKVTVEKNKIYYQGDICTSGIDTLIEKTREVYHEMKKHAHELGVPIENITIELYITSNGGAISEGFRYIDYANSLKVKFKTIVFGYAASMGFVMWLLGKERQITKNSHILIHQLSAGFGGKRADIIDYMKHLDDVQNQLVSFISENSGMSIKKTEELMAKETWLTSAEAINMGLGSLWEG